MRYKLTRRERYEHANPRPRVRQWHSKRRLNLKWKTVYPIRISPEMQTFSDLVRGVQHEIVSIFGVPARYWTDVHEYAGNKTNLKRSSDGQIC